MTSQQYLIWDNTSAANFRAWGEAVSLQLTAMGWTKTADTGQVNWTTTPAAPSSGNFVYEIREPASDPLQTGATKYYLKFEYGSRGSGPCPTLRLSLGTGTNGAGTLTGITTLLAFTTITANPITPVIGYECDFSWDTSRLGIMLWRNAPQTVSTFPATFVGIERTKNTDGTDSSDGVTLFYVTGGSSFQVVYQLTLVFGVGIAWLSNMATISVNPAAGAGTSMNFANSIPVSPVFPIYGKYGNPHTILAVVQVSDAVDGGFMTTTLYGATRTYLMSKMFGSTTPQGNNTAMLMRYD